MDWSPMQEGTPVIRPVCDVKAERRRFALLALAVCFFTLFASLIQVLLHFLVEALAPTLLDNVAVSFSISFFPMYLVALPLTLVILRFVPSLPPERKRLSFPAFLGLVAISFAVMYIGNFIGLAVTAVLGLLRGKPLVNDLQEMTANTPLWINLIFVGILAPIFEEILYRKLMIDRLRRYGDLPAALISGILFGMIHGNFNQFFYAAMAGILFGYIYLYTGKLRYTVALHMTVNLVGGVFSAELAKYLLKEPSANGSLSEMLPYLVATLLQLGLLAFVLLCFIAAPIAIVCFRKQIRFQKGECRMSLSEWLRALLVNPAVWMLFVLIGWMFLTTLL